MTLTFNDDFNSLSLWNGSTGTWATTPIYADQTGNGSSLPGNGEQEWYINNLYAPTSSVTPWTVGNGVLTLTAAPATAAVAPYLGYNQSGLPAMGSYQYTSGLIETDHSFSQTYGYFEMRAELPAGQGLWPAFWLMPQDGSWPPELDVMEVLGNDPTTLYTTVHTAQTGSHTSSGLASLVANMSTGYHTYGVDWESDKITWYFDGKPVYQVDTPADMHKPMYMIANLAVGGGWPGAANSTTPFPAQMNIDYVRAYSSLPTDVIATEAAGGVAAAGSVAAATAGTTSAGSATTTTTTPATTTTTTTTPATTTVTTTPATTTATGSGQVLVGTAGADTLIADHGGDTLTGGAGADHFVIPTLPWSAHEITDFTHGVDQLDLTALLKASGYAGSNPIADGYVKLLDNGKGGTWVYFDTDGKGTKDQWGTFVATLDHVAPSAFTLADLVGYGGVGSVAGTSTATAAGTTGAAAASQGLTLQADSTHLTLTGGAGADTLIAAHGGETLTGGAGSDHFVFQTLPWSASEITDFTHGVDLLDLTALLKASGYAGSNPIADGYVKLLDNGKGGTWVYFDTDGKGTKDQWGTFVATLDHVAPSAVTVGDLVGYGGTAGATTVATTPATTTVATTAAVATTAVSTSATGLTLQADSTHTVLVGGAGADTLIADHGPDTLTGGGGADHFVFKSIPWGAVEITDFAHGIDKLDFTGLLSANGYKGSDPIADGYVKLIDNGAGGSWVYYDTDGKGTADAWGTFVATLDHVAPSAFTLTDLFGYGASAATSAPAAAATVAGQTLQADSTHTVLVGGAGADTLIADHGPDTLTGGAGADHFVFKSLAWGASEITDFVHGVDKLDFTALLGASGYKGSDPIADGYVKLIDNGSGGSWVYYDTDGKGTADAWGTFMATLDHTAAATITASDIVGY